MVEKRDLRQNTKAFIRPQLFMFFFLQKLCNKELTFVFLGCEDIVADQISVENLVMILNWSSEPHGSSWVHRQALHFLKEEFLNVMHSPVLFDLSKQYLIQAIRSDFLQVSVQTNYPRNTITVTFYEEKCIVVKNALSLLKLKLSKLQFDEYFHPTC